MKKSLREAIGLFSFIEQLLIISGLLSYKLKIKINPHIKIASLLEKCNNYVRLIEQGVIFSNAGSGYLKALVEINQKSVSLYLRINSSDLQVFESVIQQEEYKIAAEQLKSVSGNTCLTIIDAGGNIGLTTIYLHAFYPKAKFFIIEPDEKNVTLLKINLKENSIATATVFKNALWVNNEKLITSHSFRDGKEWSISVETAKNGVWQTDNNFLQGITLQEICTNNSIERIDLLKIDIEGSERVLFTNISFLQAVNKLAKNLVIEIHDEFNIREEVNFEMKKFGFSKSEHGNITMFSKIR